MCKSGARVTSALPASGRRTKSPSRRPVPQNELRNSFLWAFAPRGQPPDNVHRERGLYLLIDQGTRIQGTPTWPNTQACVFCFLSVDSIGDVKRADNTSVIINKVSVGKGFGLGRSGGCCLNLLDIYKGILKPPLIWRNWRRFSYE